MRIHLPGGGGGVQVQFPDPVQPRAQCLLHASLIIGPCFVCCMVTLCRGMDMEGCATLIPPPSRVLTPPEGTPPRVTK